MRGNHRAHTPSAGPRRTEPKVHCTANLMSVEANHAPRQESDSLPPALRSRNPFRWVTVFGPGAVIASLTIGAGELIFSSRGGAIFGYRLLWFFVLILVSKWVLVFTAARHIVLTG